jgi:CheY-like chemotaxis protein
MNKTSAQKKILVVDDEDFLRNLYVDLLKEAGYETEGAKDGEEAYQKIKATNFDLVLLDFLIPKMDGTQVINKLKEEHGGKLPVSVVILSNMEPDFVKNKVTSLDIKGYIIKSDYNPDEFTQKVKSFL